MMRGTCPRTLCSLVVVSITAAIGLLPPPASASDSHGADRAARRGHADRAVSTPAAAVPGRDTGPDTGRPGQPGKTALTPPTADARPITLADGLVERPLWLDTSRVAEFGPVEAPSTPTLRDAAPADNAEAGEAAVAKSLAAGRLQRRDPSDRPRNLGKSASPALRDADPATDTVSAGGASNPATTTAASVASGTTVSPVFLDASGRARALPGGVIVTLASARPDADAQAALTAAGLQPLRRLTDRSWLVASEPGLPSLALANALQESGRFERVQPNWWVARQRK